MAEAEARDVSGLVDHLFRHSAGRIVSSLTRVFGPADLELVGDAVQEALEKALTHWPFRGIPDKPGGWLFAVARNAARWTGCAGAPGVLTPRTKSSS